MAQKRHGDGPDAERRLQRWSAPASGSVAAALFWQIVALAAWIAAAWAIGRGVDHLSGGESPGRAIWLIATAAMLRALAGWMSDRAAAGAGLRIVGAARAEIFAALRTQGASLFDGAGSGMRSAQVVDRTAKLAGHAARWLPGRRMAMIGPAIVLVAVATQSWVAALLLLVSVLVLPMFIWLTLGEVTAVARAQQASIDALAGEFQARAAHAGLIRAFRAVTRETATLQAASELLRERTMKVLRVAFLSTAVLEFFASVSVAMVAVYIGFALLGVLPFDTGETLTLAEGLTTLVLVPEFFAPIRKLSALHHDRADAAAAAGYLGEWLAAATARPAPTRLASRSRAPAIEFRDVAIAFDNDTGLERVSFTVRAGGFAALTGPSGSGKSTLLKALLGHAAVVAGDVLVDGDVLARGTSLAASATWLGQMPWLIEGTVDENVRLARPEATTAEVRDAVIAAGLTTPADAATWLPRAVGRGGSGLSGGQRQRIGLARVLLRGSSLLLLDEPTAHLDAVAEADFVATLRDVARSRTVLIATHSDSLRAACDVVIDVSAFGRRAVAC